MKEDSTFVYECGCHPGEEFEFEWDGAVYDSQADEDAAIRRQIIADHNSRFPDATLKLDEKAVN